MEIMKGRHTNSRVAEFGDIVMFKVPKTKLNPGKFKDQWNAGVYLGFDMSSTESLIGTPVGVFRVTDNRRRALHERWSSDKVFGQLYRRTPAFARKFASEDKKTGEFVPQPLPEQPETRMWKNTWTHRRMLGLQSDCQGPLQAFCTQRRLPCADPRSAHADRRGAVGGNAAEPPAPLRQEGDSLNPPTAASSGSASSVLPPPIAPGAQVTAPIGSGQRHAGTETQANAKALR